MKMVGHDGLWRQMAYTYRQTMIIVYHSVSDIAYLIDDAIHLGPANDHTPYGEQTATTCTKFIPIFLPKPNKQHATRDTINREIVEENVYPI